MVKEAGVLAGGLSGSLFGVSGSEWLVLSVSGPAPTLSCRMCLLEVFVAGGAQPEAQQTPPFKLLSQNSSSSTLAFPPTGAEPPPPPPPTPLPRCSFSLPCLKVGGVFPLGFTSPSRRWTERRGQRRVCGGEELTSVTPARCFCSAGISRARPRRRCGPPPRSQ